jgi:hypothetical protein
MWSKRTGPGLVNFWGMGGWKTRRCGADQRALSRGLGAVAEFLFALFQTPREVAPGESNDLLGKATSAEFRNDLKKLLASLHEPSRTIVMFELPLLPGQAELGRAQRSLAKEYGVYLIPKRYFCNILGAPQATIDGLHLSPVGSALMADLVHTVLEGH